MVKWKIGIIKSTVVSDLKQKAEYFDVNDRMNADSYGGYLICESICNEDNAKLIAAAPDMLEVLQIIVKYWNEPQGSSLSLQEHINHSLKLAEETINKATGK